LDTFTKLTYEGKSFEKIISEFSLLDKDTRQDKILFVLKRFSLWCQQDHPESTYQTRGRTEYHKKKQPRTIMSYASRIRDVLDSVYGIELNVPTSLMRMETESRLIFLFYEQIMDKKGMNP